MAGVAVTLIGFDSAWKDKPHNPGALCAIRVEGDRVRRCIAPSKASFCEALRHIRSLGDSDAVTIIGFDQPTRVPNETGCRPVERVVNSALGGGVQPAYRKKLDMFGEAAPVWSFLQELGAIEDPERTRTAEAGLFILEVFPALALRSMNPDFLQSPPRYNPKQQRTFRLQHWRAAAKAVGLVCQGFGLGEVAQWCSELMRSERPLKCDQDKLDSIICMLVAWSWRFCLREQVAMIGDLTNGYMVAPVSSEMRARLSSAAARLGVPIT
jgi:predicted RNase H-like nuclease